MQRHESQAGGRDVSAHDRDEEPLRGSDFAVTARLADVPWADVTLAAHRATGRAYVLLAWRTAVHRDERLARRVTREVAAARVLHHSGIAHVHGRGVASDGRWFLAAEYVDGASLADLLDAEGRLTPRRFVRLARDAMSALAAAHTAGVFHGHLTPDNLIIPTSREDARSAVVLSGFGTAAGRAGTLGEFRPPVIDRPYLSPERVAGLAPDARSDLFSLASLLQLALDGSPPLVVRTGTGTAAAGRTGEVADADVPVWHRTVSGVLARARAADPERRHTSVQAFHDELFSAIAMYGDLALAGPALNLLDRAAEAATLTATAPTGGTWDGPADVDEPPRTGPPVASWAVPRATDAAPAEGDVFDGAAAARLRPELEITVVAAPNAPPHQRGARSAPPDWVPAAPLVGVRGAWRARRETLRSTATVVGAGLLAFTAGYLGHAYATDDGPAPPTVRRPLADLSVVPGSPRTGPPALVTVGPGDAAAARRRDASSVLTAYADAIEARDLDAVARIYPGITDRERDSWRALFQASDTIHARLILTDARPVGAFVLSEVRGSYTFRMLRPPRSMEQNASFVAVLEQTTDGWRMRAVR